MMPTGHRPGEARALLVLGKALAGTDRRHAHAAWRQALALFSDMGMPEAAEVRELIRVTSLT
jgi:hypothetical protein